MGCGGTEFEAIVSGVYVPYEGDCGNTGGRQPFYNQVTEHVLYFQTLGMDWNLAATCGTQAIAAAGKAGYLPFLDTETSWQCAPTGAWYPMSIECALYNGQRVPCKMGTYNITGKALNGLCTECPVLLESSSKPGSTIIDDCFTVTTNVFVTAKESNRIVALNADTDDYQLIKEGGEVDEPYDSEFITETELVVSMFEKSKVVKFNIEGQVVGTFAIVSRPYGILRLPELSLVAIFSCSSFKEVLFFDVRDYVGEPLQESDAVGKLFTIVGNADEPKYLSRGENPDEILIATHDNKVVRMYVLYRG